MPKPASPSKKAVKSRPVVMPRRASVKQTVEDILGQVSTKHKINVAVRGADKVHRDVKYLTSLLRAAGEPRTKAHKKILADLMKVQGITDGAKVQLELIQDEIDKCKKPEKFDCDGEEGGDENEEGEEKEEGGEEQEEEEEEDKQGGEEEGEEEEEEEGEEEEEEEEVAPPPAKKPKAASLPKSSQKPKASPKSNASPKPKAAQKPKKSAKTDPSDDEGGAGSVKGGWGTESDNGDSDTDSILRACPPSKASSAKNKRTDWDSE
jgi:hypothetical protein